MYVCMYADLLDVMKKDCQSCLSFSTWANKKILSVHTSVFFQMEYQLSSLNIGLYSSL